MSVTNTCPTCGEDFHPILRYYAGPFKEHIRGLGNCVVPACAEVAGRIIRATQHKRSDP